MKITGILWLRDIVDKLAVEHNVETDEAVLFIYKQTREALIVSARDMAQKERRQYGRK